MRHWILLLIAGFMLGQSRAGTLPCIVPSEADVLHLFTRWNSALQSGDARAVVAHYAGKSVLLTDRPDQIYLSAAQKRRYFRDLLKRRPVATVNERQLEVGCNAAVDAGTYTLRFADGSVQTAGYSFSYQRFGGQWLIVSHHSATLPALPSPGGQASRSHLLAPPHPPTETSP